ncbi:MAG: Thiol:disulfide interchange protein DsbD precursor [Firmicutes bacterium ADurb.Bin080]|jgi:cytochrome c-type biogenesis protein|nr:cytochrome c biogenesis protein CcdA [Clostridiales bacterium]OQC14076.1 MAG: Thiol:disulfide interchange protein DsbD precursor [Firmicutes bacterium ADurb.Bin080]
MIDTWLAQLSNLLTQYIWLGPLISFAAGIIASFTPCCLSSLPLIIGYVGGYSEDRKKAFFYSLMYAVGSIIVFTIMGIIAAFVGHLFLGIQMYWYIFLGLLMVVMSLQSFGIIHIFKHKCGPSPVGKKKGAIGALLVGMVSSVFASPCSTPVLIAIVAVVSTGQSIAMGAIMLLTYAIGHSILAVAAGTSVGWVKGLSRNPKFEKAGKIINIVMGILLLAFALYLFYVAFSGVGLHVD